MKCSDLQFNLTLYSDGCLRDVEIVSVKAHLEVCPLCRQKHSEYRELGAGLRTLRKPEISLALKNKLKGSVRDQMRLEKRSTLPVSTDIREWLQMRVLPYGVGVFATAFVAVTFLTMMFSGMLRPTPSSMTATRGDSSIMLANGRNAFDDPDGFVISPTEYAHSRMAFSSQSPSINTQGALIALTRSLIRGGMKDDEVVVVAEVFGNGLARIAEVVEPSHDAEAINELEKAFRSGNGDSPFVPSSVENRPENMMIVLKFQTVDVSTSAKRTRRRS